MKKSFTEPKLEILRFTMCDVIATSATSTETLKGENDIKNNDNEFKWPGQQN